MFKKMKLCLLVMLFSFVCSMPSFASEGSVVSDYNAFNEQLLTAAAESSDTPTIQAYVDGQAVSSFSYNYSYIDSSGEWYFSSLSEGAFYLPELDSGFRYVRLYLADLRNFSFTYPFTLTFVINNVDPDLFTGAYIYDTSLLDSGSPLVPISFQKNSSSVMCSYTFDTSYEGTFTTMAIHFRSGFTGPLTGTITSNAELFSMTYMFQTYTEIFQWFLTNGGLLLSWMLDKPVILLSLTVVFVFAVVMILSRIYHTF